MRVALVGGAFASVPPKHYGGTEQVINYLIRGLRTMGHEPILLGPATSKVDCELIPTIDEEAGFPTTKKQLAETEAHLALHNRMAARALTKLLPRIDIIHSHGFDLRAFQNFPNVTTVHNPITFDNLSYYLQRRTQPLIAISQSLRDTLPELAWAGVAYNGEDPADFPFVSKPQNYVCFLGRFDEHKNPHLAIELALKLGIRIKLGGKIDAEGRDYFNKRVKPYLKHRLVEYIGEADFETKVKLISHARANLHPTSFREPFGLTVIEAAFTGTPTLAIRRGSMPEVIKQGVSGSLVEDFVEGYTELPKCFDLDRQAVAEFARATFNHLKTTQQYVRLYKQVIAAHKTNA